MLSIMAASASIENGLPMKCTPGPLPAAPSRGGFVGLRRQGRSRNGRRLNSRRRSFFPKRSISRASKHILVNINLRFTITRILKIEKGFHSAVDDLKPKKQFVVYPGREQFSLGQKIEAIGLPALAKQLQTMK